MKIEVDAPRPLAAVATLLEERFGQVVTYEDAPYAHPADMVRDEGGRTIPRGGPLAVEYGPADGVREITAACLQAHRAQGYPGVYALHEHDGAYGIVPQSYRNADGATTERTPLLDHVISLPPQTCNASQVVEDIARALSEATGESVTSGMVPINSFMQHESSARTLTGKAGDVLTSLFRELGGRYSWQLLNHPGSTDFFLNIHQVAQQGAGD